MQRGGPLAIGITLGDPSGIGPEIAAQAIGAAGEPVQRRLIVYCDRPILERAYAQVWGERVPAWLEVVDRGRLSADQAVLGRPSLAGGAAQVAYLEAAVSAARGGGIGGLVTAPISKTQAHAAGFDFPGHTEFLAARLGGAEVRMMFAGPKLKVVLATVHLPLAAVPGALTIDGLVTTVRLAAATLRRDFGIARPRLGVVGLNPHAGEQGMFGREELEVIGPAIEEARRQLSGMADSEGAVEILGPLIPDAAFRDAVEGRYHLLVALYHDQGLIPVKLVDFEEAVNVTLGLPIVRTSPDHGVAYDIAGSGRARATSFAAALRLAVELVDRRAAPP
jgi:4-hydroxythreonine-4-phosphate dehydrogenase